MLRGFLIVACLLAGAWSIGHAQDTIIGSGVVGMAGGGVPVGVACTGGTRTTSGANTIFTFTASGTLNCSSSFAAQVLVVAGGGGGANGGGGAGGYCITGGSATCGLGASFTIPMGATTVTVSGGGAGQTFGGVIGTNGTDSIFSTIDAVGGGGGGNTAGGAAGGSGGGASTTASTSGGAGTATQGNAGGNQTGANECAAGGGGANAAGGAGSNSGSGAGGNGLSTSISGASVTYAGGGGGAARNTFCGGVAGAGGAGGGGAGGYNGNGTAATANTGGGGGGASFGGTGGNGGSGIVIISCATSVCGGVGVQASRAKNFTNSVGMGDPNNVAGATVYSALSYMGISTARSDVPIPGDGGSNYNYLANLGVMFNFLWANDYLTYSCINNASAISQTFSLIDTFVTTYPGAMLANEGPNETNNFPVCYYQNATTNNSTSTSSAVLHFATTPPELVTAANATYTDSGTINVGSGFTVIDTNQTIDPGSNYASFALNTSVVVTITINSPNEFLVMFTATNSGAVTGVPTDTLGLTWTLRANNGGTQPEEEFTAAGPTGGSYPQTDTITINCPSGYIAAGVIGVVGANLSSPFDGTAVTSLSDPITISTSHTNTVVLAGFRTNNSAPTAGAGYTQLFNGFYTLNEYQTFTSTQSGLSVTIGTGAGTANGGIADAIVLTGAPRAAAIPANTSIVSATSTSVTMSANAQNGGVQSGDVIQFSAVGVEPSTLVPVTASSLAWQASIYNATKADANLTSVKVANYTGFVPGATPQPPSVAGTADYNNTHFYPTAGQQPVPYTGAPSMIVALNPANQPIPGLVTVITETGYCTPSAQSGAVDQTTQAILLLNEYFDMFSAGVPYTLVYTLFDGNTGDSSCFDNYGVFESDQATPKTAGTAIKNMQTILNDPAGTALTFSPGKLNYSITGLPTGGSGGFTYVLQKVSGTWEVVIWSEPQIWNDTTHSEITPSTVPITVNLGATFTTVNVYDPMVGTSPVSTSSGVSSVSLSLVKDPVIVEAIP